MKLIKKKWKYIVLTLGFTWLIQFIPILFHMDVESTSVSSFDFSSIFFTIGGMMPSLIAVIIVLATYLKKEKKDYFKRCFTIKPSKLKWIFVALAFICLEVFVTQTICKLFFHAEPLGFTGIKAILSEPYLLFYYLFWGLISGPISEEFGWRGYLLDKFLKTDNILKASLIVGFVWGIWHLPLFFYPTQMQYQLWKISPFWGIGFILNCMSNSLVYSVIYILVDRHTFAIFFLHMFENIILTGIMIYPWSSSYNILVIPVSIVLDVLFFVIAINTKGFQSKVREQIQQIKALPTPLP